MGNNNVPHATNQPVLVDVENVTKSYNNRQGNVLALNNISVRIYKQEYVVFHGPSGSGKSTLLSVLGCLEGIDSGCFSIAGTSLEKANASELAIARRNHIGFVFQDYNLLSHMTLLENTMLPLLYRGIQREEAIASAYEALEKTHLADRATHLPGELSGGQNQRGAIARAIVHKPQLILADEPTGALDSETSQVVMGLLKETIDYGHTLVVVSHDPEIVRQAPRQIRIESGHLYETPSQLG